MHLRRAVGVCCSVLGLCATAGAAWAGEDDNDRRNDIVVTGARDSYVPQDTGAAKVPMSLRDLPQSVAVVPEQVLRDQRALSFQDALKNVPGVSFASGDGQRDQVSIRGFTAIADQFVDGFRDDALYFRDLSNVERLEVVKGPAAVLYGRGSSGGLINRVTKKPDRNVTGAAFSAGSFDSYRGEFDIGRLDRDSGAGFRLTGALEDDGSFRNQQFLKRFAIAPSIAGKIGEDTDILAQVDYLNDRRMMDLGIPAINGRPVDVDPSTYYGAANGRQADFVTSKVWSQRVSATHRFSDNLSLRNGFSHYRYLLDRQSTNPSAVNAAAQTVTLQHGRFDRDEQGWSNQTELTQKLEAFGTKHTILYGFEIAHQNKLARRSGSRTVATTNIFNPVLPVVNNDDPFYDTLTDNSTTVLNTRGLYAQDLIDFGRGIKLMLGLRHDWYIQSTEQRVGNFRLSRTDKQFSPRAGIIWQPDDVQSYYVSWSRSFQPSAETFALATNNSDLAPEKTTNKEIGAKYTLFGGRLSINVAGFILRRTGIKASDPTGKLVAVGTQRTRGAEFSAALELPDNLRAIAGYSYLDTRVTDSPTPGFAGKRATITPLNSANLFLTKTIQKNYGIGGGMNYVGDRWADPQNTTVLPSYVTFDALAWAQIGLIRLQLNAYNLADKRYIISGHGTSPILNVPGAPRSVMGTVRLDF